MSDDTPDDISTRETPAPPSIKLAAAALLLFLVSTLILGTAMVRGGGASFWQITVRLLIASAILYGTVAGDRLAWLWGRILALVTAVLTMLPVILAVVNGPGLDPEKWILHAWLFAQVAALLVVLIAFGRPSAKRYFGLICPTCGASTRQPADVFFRRARCSDCGKVW